MKKKNLRSKPIKTIEKKIEKKIETQIEEKYEKDRDRIERFKREHKRFLWFVSTVVLHVKLFLKKNTEDNINALSGQSAFFLILSAVPMLMLIMAIIAFFGGKPDESAMQQVASQSNGIGATAQTVGTLTVSDFVVNFVREAYDYASSGVIIVTAVMALWSAGRGLYIITDGISRIYRIPQKHMWLLRRIFAMGYTIILLLMMVVSIALMLINSLVDHYLEQTVGRLPLSTMILYTLRYVIATVIIALFLTLALKLYLRGRVQDKRYVKYRVLLPGMVFTAIAWDVLAWGVSLYSKYFTSSMYGSFGTVFIIMMWIYFMMLLLLYGVQINYIYREQFYRFSFKKLIRRTKKAKKQ